MIGNTFSVPMMSGKILHVQIGLDGLWDPSQPELDAYLKMFTEVARAGGIVVTTRGVQVDLIDLQK